MNAASFPQQTGHFMACPHTRTPGKFKAELIQGCFSNSEDTVVDQFLAPPWSHLLTLGPGPGSFHVWAVLTQTRGWTVFITTEPL